jgi:hypothetical protein
MWIGRQAWRLAVTHVSTRVSVHAPEHRFHAVRGAPVRWSNCIRRSSQGAKKRCKGARQSEHLFVYSNYEFGERGSSARQPQREA